MNNELMFSSKNDQWSTPQDFFDDLNAEFGFTLDVCAQDDSAKCENYYTVETDGLDQDWSNNVCWMNPPYGRGKTGVWMEKAYKESLKGATIVCLIPARTCTRWFHDWILGKAEIRFVKGRLKFGGSKNGAPFPSLVVVYRGAV